MKPPHLDTHESSRFDWQRFHAYRVFDEFLERFVLQRKSYVTRHSEPLDLASAFEEIRRHFVEAFDESEAPFDEKVTKQFESASEQSKIVFANIEFLWAMPMENISPRKKRSYALRWFPGPNQVISGDRFFFGAPHIIADPGSWYLRNKYWELVAALRVFSLVTADPSLTDHLKLKQKIAEVCHSAVYKGIPAGHEFAVSKVCGIHSVLMHLADPERYEAIISASHRRQICAVLGHVVDTPSPDAEVLLKQIRSTLYDSHGNSEDPDWKYRWFFYSKDVRPLWIDKNSKKEQRAGAAAFDVRSEEDAGELEGEREDVTVYRIRRSAKLVRATKERDYHTCRACGFHFEDQIVHVHHLDPISEYKSPQTTKLDDLLTLCPTCHHLAHYWLRVSPRYKELEALLAILRTQSAPIYRQRTHHSDSQEGDHRLDPSGDRESEGLGA